MKTYSIDTIDALNARTLVARDFLWIKARTFDTGLPFQYGFWSDVGDVTVTIVDPDTGLPDSRDFEGAGTLVEIGDISLVSNLSVQSVDIRLSQIDEAVASVVRGYDLRQAVVEVYRLMFDPDTRLPLAPELPRFVGFIDGAPIVTPAEGGEGGITLRCVSHTQELTRSNPDTRSHDSQILRSATDDFLVDATVVGDWETFWGQASEKAS